MIVYKKWRSKSKGTFPEVWECDGWFLFGKIPLYIRKVKVK